MARGQQPANPKPSRVILSEAKNLEAGLGRQILCFAQHYAGSRLPSQNLVVDLGDIGGHRLGGELFRMTGLGVAAEGRVVDES